MVVERETSKLLRCNRIDNGGDYFSKSFEEYCSKHGIKNVKTFPCTPQQNGTTWENESDNNGEGEKYAFKSLFSQVFLGRGCSYSFLLNKSLSHNLIGWWHSVKRYGPDKGLCYTHPKKMFGCKAYVHIPKNGGSSWMKSHWNAFSWNMLIMS
jgi:hypothetical protein